MKTSEEIDEVWISLKPIGTFQKIQIAYLYFALFQVAAVVMIFVLLGHVPEFSCSRLHEPLSQYGIPSSEGNISDYHLNYGKCKISMQPNTTNSTFQAKYTLPCKEGYTFDHTEGDTIISEWNLVCDQSGVGELGQTLVMAGQIVGATLFTSLADRYGRKPVFVSTHLILFVMCLALVFVPTFVVFAIMRFVIGALQQGMGLASSIITLEIVPQQYRGIIGAIGQFTWTGFVVVLAAIGYFMRNLSWRYVQLTTALLSIHALASYWIVDESLRWLIANKKKDEAKRIIKKVAKINNVSEDKLAEVTALLDEHELVTRVPCNNGPTDNRLTNGRLIENAGDSSDEDTLHNTGTTEANISRRKPTFLDILRHKRLLRNSFVLWFTWCVNSLTYFGLYLTSTSLTGNRHLNFFLNGLVELPGGILYAILVNRIGRKKSSILFHAMTGLSLIASVVILELADEESPLVVLSTVLNYIGKLGIAASFALLFLYTPELYPTNVRNVGLGVCSAAARVGGMIAPYSNMFASYVMWGPGVVFGTCCVLVSVLTLILPETCGKELPQTIEEYNDWARDRTILKRKKEKVKTYT